MVEKEYNKHDTSMKYFILAQILFLTSLVGFAQQVMLSDSITQNPVCYATVYDANGTVIGRSDMGGYISLQKGFEYYISHINYRPKSFVYNDDSIIILSPSFYTISEVSVTAKKRKYYHCKVFFRSIEHVDSCLKYYMDGIREFFIDTKSKKVHRGNVETNYFMSKRKDIAQKKRSMMIGDRYMALPFLDKNTLYEETMRDKKRNIESGIVYADSISIGSYEIRSDNSEMLLSIDALWPKNSLPSVFNLKSSNSYRHLTLTHKKENLVRDIDVEDMFYVVEYEYTDTKELSSSELLQEDYKKYSGMFPIPERIREQLVRGECFL